MSLPPFWSLVENHGAELHRYARSLAGPRADDVFQEAMLRALRSYPRVTSADHLRAWLFRIVTTTAYDSHRKGSREVPTERVPDRVSEPAYDDGMFESLVGELPEGARRTLTLRFVNDLSYAQIARRLGCTEAAARQRVSSAVRTLRRKLA